MMTIVFISWNKSKEINISMVQVALDASVKVLGRFVVPLLDFRRQLSPVCTSLTLRLLCKTQLRGKVYTTTASIAKSK